MAASSLWSIFTSTTFTSIFTSTTFLTILLLVALAALSYYYIVKAPFLQFSNMPQKKPHWFMGNKSFGAINEIDAVKQFYTEMKQHRFVKICIGIVFMFRFCIFWEGSN